MRHRGFGLENGLLNVIEGRLPRGVWVCVAVFTALSPDQESTSSSFPPLLTPSPMYSDPLAATSIPLCSLPPILRASLSHSLLPDFTTLFPFSFYLFSPPLFLLLFLLFLCLLFLRHLLTSFSLSSSFLSSSFLTIPFSLLFSFSLSCFLFVPHQQTLTWQQKNISKPFL